MAKQEEKPKTPRDLRRQAREIADSLAIAFILAMIIRHYVLEVFKIPTKSMEPTLLGDPWSGDKILVNKFTYDLREPRRWEIAVFKYPQDTTKNYIKRVVGLPGETLRVRCGDLYVNDRIARKPWRVQQALWRLCPHSGEAKSWQPSRPDDAARWTLADGAFEADARSAPDATELDYARDILAYEATNNSYRARPLPTILTSDIMVQFRLLPRQSGGSVSVGIDVYSPQGLYETSRRLLDRWRVVIPLDRAEGSIEVYRNDAHFASSEPCRFPPGRATLVQVCNVDQSTIVRVDGREVLRKEHEPGDDASPQAAIATAAKVSLGCRQAHVTLRDPGIYVDVYYTDHPNTYGVREPFQLGPDEYFAMGDNSVNSNDSRAWKTVPRSYLVGEAFQVLWPLGRMRLVR